MSVHVKVCGFTRPGDVTAAVEAGVDCFGFNLAKGPRRLDLERAAALAALVPTDRSRVALFIDADEDAIQRAMAATGCDTVQLHGDAPPEMAASLAGRYRVFRAFRIRDAASLKAVVGYPAHVYLLDAWVPGAEGGTGETWDHSLLAGRDLGRPLMLAGGLTPDNVAEAVATVRPWGVDTASGVEGDEPGLKDHAKVRAYVEKARRAAAC